MAYVESTSSKFRNRAPIFVNGFAYGGSNILVNLLLSHPNLCFPSGETQKVFRGGASVEPLWRTFYKRIAYNLPVTAAVGPGFFSTDNIDPRPLLGALSQRFIDHVLYYERFAARHERHNRFVSEGREYSRGEIAAARVLCKNLNGLIQLTDNFAAMYPDATFFGLVRNGLALCQGYVRRGRSAREFGRMYALLAQKMVDDAQARPNYHIVRFERIVANPIAEMTEIYRLANLDIKAITKIRLQMKATLSESGRHELASGYDRQLVWYTPEQLGSYFKPDIDNIQIAQLADDDRIAFLDQAAPAMKRLGYLT
jgi:hypothetical protein